MAAIVIRPATAADRHYLLDNFSRAYKHSGYANGTSTEVLKQLLEPLLATWTTLIACPANDQNEIVAWLLFRDSAAVGWLHTRPGVRRHGIAQRLLDHAGIKRGEIEIPFMPTKLEGAEGAFSAIAKAHGYALRFRPYCPQMVALDVERALKEVV